jgi:hypothetical protein
MDKHASKTAAMHRQHATGISNLVAAPGHGLNLPSFTRFLDFHLPAAKVDLPGSKAFHLLRSSIQDRVCSVVDATSLADATLRHMHPVMAIVQLRKQPQCTVTTNEPRIVHEFSALQAWGQDSFQCKQPSGRQDAWELRKCLHTELHALNSSTEADASRDAMLAYAEEAIRLYNTAYFELTRQVRCAHCPPVLGLCAAAQPLRPVMLQVCPAQTSVTKQSVA